MLIIHQISGKGVTPEQHMDLVYLLRELKELRARGGGG